MAFWIGLFVFGLGIVFSYRVYRRKYVKAVADKLGFTFHANPPMFDEIRSFPMTGFGRRKKCTNSIEGEADGIKIKLFDYSYWHGSGRNQTIQLQTVAYVKTTHHEFPCFQVRPKSLFDKLFNGSDVTIAPEFDRHFRVTSYQDSTTRALFGIELIDELLAHRWCLEVDGDQFVLYRHGTTVNHTMLESFLRDGLKVMMMLQSGVDNPSPVAAEPEIVVGPDGRLSLAKSGA